MKFGKFIQEHQSEWGGSHYLNYKALKKIINSVDGDQNSLLAVSSPVNQSQELQALKTAFFFKLERELEKINAFYLQKEAEFKVRLRSLVDKKRIIVGRTSGVVPSALENLKESISLFQHDLTKLQNFVEVNATGFRKILKKWDKRAKSSTKELYLSRQIEIQPVFNNDVLTELTDAATTTLAELEVLLENFEKAGPSSAAVRKSKGPSDDTASDLENDLVGLVHDNRVAEITDFLEKRKTSTNDSENDLLSRVYIRICTEASIEMLALLLGSTLVDCNFADDINNRTCLHEAAIVGKLDVIKLSCEHGARIDSLDMYGRTPVHYSAMYGHLACSMFLLSSGSVFNSVDLDDCSPLYYCIVGGHTESVRAFLDSGVNVESPSGSGPSPLYLACEHGHKDIAQLLLGKGAKVATHGDGLTELHVAARHGHAELCSLLISNGAEVDAVETFNGWTPVFFSASEGHLDCVKVLIAAKCSIDVTDENGWLPWTYALHRGHISVAELLEVKAVSAVAPVASLAQLPDSNVGLQPMAPSALFIEDVNMDGEDNIDAIPMLSLPPPIIPFRIYGHNYLDKKYYIQVSFGTFSDSDETRPIKLFGSRQLSSLKMIISSKPDVGIPYSVILPIKDDSEVFSFLVDDLNDFSLQFDIFPTFGTKVLGRAIVLSSQLMMAASKRSAGAGDNEKCISPLFDSHLRVVGELSFEFSIVNAFDHPSLQIGGKVETYWKTTQVVGKSNSESGVRSFITASSLAEEYINLVIQMTKDGVLVIYPNWMIPVSRDLEGIAASLCGITHKQARMLFEAISQRSFDSTLLARAATISQMSDAIYSSLFSLEEVLKTLPTSIGLCVEIKYPTAWEREALGMGHIADVNQFVDAVLKTIYDNALGRPIIFSSLNPSVCTTLSWKQPNYGVFFKSRCGFSNVEIAPHSHLSDSDKRCGSIKEAVRFAKKNNFLGLICQATPLIKVPLLANTIKESGLILVSFGDENNDVANTQVQESAGVDAIIAGNVVQFQKIKKDEK